MQRKLFALSAAALALSLSTAANAQGAGDREGFYVFGGVGAAMTQWDAKRSAVPAGQKRSQDKTGTSYVLGGGYRFNQYFAVEGSYHDMSQWGTQRWAANNGRDWKWITDHYFNNNDKPAGMRNAFRSNGGGSNPGGAPGTVDTNGTPLNVRSGPGTSYSVVGTLADGASVTIQCQTTGTSVTGTYGTSSIWNRIGSGRFIPDAYTYTGSDGRVTPDC